MIYADSAFSPARSAYQSRSPGDSDWRPGRFSGEAELTEPSDPEDSGEIQEADREQPGRRSLRQLHLAVTELSNALSNALQEEWDTAEECAQRASFILKSPSLFPHSGLLVTVKPSKPPIHIRGGLAPWQVRQVTRYIESNLEASIQTRDLAALVKLSPFHFCRAFRSSFDDSPHGYVMRRRVERAQGLLLTTNAPLAQIAVECGMADQAHFNKLFRRFVGDTPGSWRRARAIATPATLPAVDPHEDVLDAHRRPCVLPSLARASTPLS